MAIFVTKSFLPPIEEYNEYVKKIYSTAQLTNQGPLLKELESKLKRFLKVENFHFLTNGTIALQLGLEALNIKDGEIITTPFSYVATTSSILWQRCKPVFVDIEDKNFTIDPDKIESAITEKTKAIMAVHVFGYSCDVDKIQKIADKYNLKVIYDGAHAFGSNLKGKSLLEYGDLATLSFHATKLFHTVEGGACIVRDKEISEKLELIKRFGHHGDEHFCLGINGKQSEFHAAMGLANLPYIEQIIRERKRVTDLYDRLIDKNLQRPKMQEGLEYNYAYYPVLFKSETALLDAFEKLKKHDIYARRYFYPSLNKLPYVDFKECQVAEDISSRIACLPLYPELANSDILRIVELIL